MCAPVHSLNSASVASGHNDNCLKDQPQGGVCTELGTTRFCISPRNDKIDIYRSDWCCWCSPIHHFLARVLRGGRKENKHGGRRAVGSARRVMTRIQRKTVLVRVIVDSDKEGL